MHTISMKTTMFVLLATITSTSYALANDRIEMKLPNLVRAAEIKYDLPEGLLEALVSVESSGNHKAKNIDDGTSSDKAVGRKIASYGLIQMQLESARFVQRIKSKEEGIKLNKNNLITPKVLMKPEVNLEYGAAYMRWLLDTHKNNVAWALTCYNAGPNSFLCKNKKYNGDYVGKVLNAMIQGR